jgi:hypothetical protein
MMLRNRSPLEAAVSFSAMGILLAILLRDAGWIIAFREAIGNQNAC